MFHLHFSFGTHSVSIYPICPDHEQPLQVPRPCNCSNVRWRRPNHVGNRNQEEEDDQTPETIFPDTVLRERIFCVEKNASDKHDTLNNECCCFVIPQTQAHFGSLRQSQRKIRTVSKKIKQPMTRYTGSDK